METTVVSPEIRILSARPGALCEELVDILPLGSVRRCGQPGFVCIRGVVYCRECFELQQPELVDLWKGAQ